MSKIFDFIDITWAFAQWIVKFILQMFSIITQAVPIVQSLLSTAFIYAPVLCGFFVVFLSFSVILFIWRLIP